ncbi:C4b-binding protein alpha chain-like isoform 2-T2 [Pangshura tecta]
MELLRPSWAPRLSALLVLALLPRGALGNCGAPPRLSFAELLDAFKTQTDFPVGTKVTYSCRPGYQKVPGQSVALTCENESVWSKHTEFCQVKSCGHPGDLLHGKVDITDLSFGSSITFSCDEGFRLVGQKTSQCVISERGVTWNHEIPLCDDIPCHPPPEIKDGMYSNDPSSHYTYGSTVTYRCNAVPRGTDSFSLIGEASIHCTSDEEQNGVWSGAPPECKVVKCSNVEIKNGRKQSGFGPSYTYKDAITFGCDAGYFLVGSEEIICQANNSWSPATPTCEKKICSALVFPHGEVFPLKSEYADGESVTLTCNANYFLLNGVKSMTVQCKKNTWNLPIQTCQMVKCSNVEVENGRKLNGFGPSYTYKDAITFGCDAGYFLVGSEEIICQANNSWSPATPTCEKITPHVCGTPPFPKGTIFPSKPRYATEDGITLTCEANYVLFDDAKSMTVHCKGNNVWHPPVQTCKLIPSVCSAPAFPNGKILPSKPQYVTGDGITLTCEANYVLRRGEKSMTVYCKGNNVWDPPVQACIPVCPDPVIPHGKVKSGAKLFYVGDQVAIECSTFHALHGEPNIECTDGFQWKPAIPECKLRVYIIIIIVIVIVIGVILVVCCYKKYFSQKGKRVSTSATAQYTSCKT